MREISKNELKTINGGWLDELKENLEEVITLLIVGWLA